LLGPYFSDILFIKISPRVAKAFISIATRL